MADKVKGVVTGIKEGIIETVKAVPILGGLIEGVRAYQENIQEQQREEFIRHIAERLTTLEQVFRDEWYQSPEGMVVTQKIVSSVLNAEFVDKTEYFANAMFNASDNFAQVERLKFVEILRAVSKPALIVLAKEHELKQRRDRFSSNQVIFEDLVSELREHGFTPHLVETCMNELYSLGVFSSTVRFHESGRAISNFNNGTAAYTEFTQRFINFIKDPRI